MSNQHIPDWKIEQIKLQYFKEEIPKICSYCPAYYTHSEFCPILDKYIHKGSSRHTKSTLCQKYHWLEFILEHI